MTDEAPAYRRSLVPVPVAAAPTRPAAATTRPERVAAQLAALAAAAEPGTRLGTKDELRRQCEVSVGTFNEALRLVQARGVITVRTGRVGGLFSTRQSPLVRLGNSVLALDDEATSVADAVRIRDALDPLLVEDAVRHASAHSIAEMRGELELMRAAVEDRDSIAFIHANWALHARIAETSPSIVLRSFYLSLLEIIEAHTLSVQSAGEQPLTEYIASRYDLHVALVQAIADRDGTRATRLVEEHNTTTGAPALDTRHEAAAREGGTALAP
jgi:DNA-binding FadR family transcriptional regulator